MLLIDALRFHTRQPHEALHRHPLLRGLAGDGITLAAFHNILLAFEAYYTVAEAACATVIDDIPNAPVLAWLASDLAQHRLLSLSGRVEVPTMALDTPARVAGYLYTKQGSTLGGHVISKHLERSLGLIPHIDQWFFAAYGRDNGPQWKRFVAYLDAHEDALPQDEVVEAARQAFAAITKACDCVYEMSRQHAA